MLKKQSSSPDYVLKSSSKVAWTWPSPKLSHKGPLETTVLLEWMYEVPCQFEGLKLVSRIIPEIKLYTPLEKGAYFSGETSARFEAPWQVLWILLVVQIMRIRHLKSKCRHTTKHNTVQHAYPGPYRPRDDLGTS